MTSSRDTVLGAEYRKNKRLTKEYLATLIKGVDFEVKEVFGQKSVWCNLLLDNGFIVYGDKPRTSIDPANFDVEKGKQLAYDDTFAQLWKLFSFAAIEQAHQDAQFAELVDVRDYIDVLDTSTHLEPQTYRTRYTNRCRIKATGREFLIRGLVDDGINRQDEIIKELVADLGVEIINPDRVVKIARLCHNANKAYCESLGDTSQPTWEDAPVWQRDSAIAGVKFHLAGDHPPAASHENWMKQKVAEGSVYGPVKDPEAKEHPCMVAYDELPVEQRTKDYIFISIVHSFK